jgi:Txe/YoeB family toxin of Txe-Axe toxin-antitoxin module
MADEVTSGQASSGAPSPETGGQAQAGGRAPQFAGRGEGRGARGETTPTSPQRETAQAGTPPGGETTPAGDAPPPEGAKDKGFNLFEDENFRKVQSAWQRQLSDLQRQNLEMAKRVRESELKGMDDFEKLQYEKQELESSIKNMQQQRELEIMAYQRQQDIAQIAEQTGVESTEIEQATDYANAWQRAALTLRQQVDKLQKQVDRLEGKKAAANAPYLGGGTTGSAAGGDMSSAFEAAKRSRDPAAWVRAVRESRR